MRGDLALTAAAVALSARRAITLVAPRPASISGRASGRATIPNSALVLIAFAVYLITSRTN